MKIDPEVQETIRRANVEIDRLRSEVDRLKQYERGELVPGSVVSESMAAIREWIEQEAQHRARGAK